MKKIISSFGISLLAIFSIAMPLSVSVPVYAQTDFCYNFTRNLKYGDSGPAVSALQTALEANLGTSLAADEPSDTGGTSHFGDVTASAVTAFQEKYTSDILAPNGITHGTGFVGASTRAKLNALYGCTSSSSTPSPISRSTQCPAGFTCTPISQNPAPVCPPGYTCTPASNRTNSSGSSQVTQTTSSYPIRSSSCLSISGISPGSTNLTVGQNGYWNVVGVDTCPSYQGVLYSVSWGDGTTAPGQSMSTFNHSYSSAGTYTITFTVTEPNTGISAQRTLTVVVTGQQNNSCLAINGISPGSSNLTVGQSGYWVVNGVDTCSTYSGDLYSVNWGDGTTAAGQSLNSFNHSYSSPGTYTITFTISEPNTGISVQKQFTVIVTGQQSNNCLSISGISPGSTNLTVGQNGYWNVVGVDTCPSYQGVLYSVSWGDGTTAPGQSMSTFNHSYSSAGTYTITFTVTEPNTGISAQRTLTVNVTGTNQPASALLSLDPSSPVVSSTPVSDVGNDDYIRFPVMILDIKAQNNAINLRQLTVHFRTSGTGVINGNNASACYGSSGNCLGAAVQNSAITFPAGVTIPANTTMAFTIKVDVLNVGSPGFTITPSVTSSDVTAVDSQGNNVQVSGSVNGNAQTVTSTLPTCPIGQNLMPNGALCAPATP